MLTKITGMDGHFDKSSTLEAEKYFKRVTENPKNRSSEEIQIVKRVSAMESTKSAFEFLLLSSQVNLNFI